MYRDASMDIKATEPYIRKMFKAVHSLVLQVVQAMYFDWLTNMINQEEPARPVALPHHPPPRYNPLVAGFKSVDGEYVKFHRVMKARGQVGQAQCFSAPRWRSGSSSWTTTSRPPSSFSVVS